MKKGLHYSVNLKQANFTETEIEIINNFGRLFSITFANTHNFKGVNYHYAFLKPSSELIEQFRFQSEIIILFNTHHDFDSRTFDYVDKLMSDYQNRLDKLCVIIVSKDNAIKKKINNLVAQNAESRIIIPFTYLDFLKASNAVITIESRLKEYFYGRDLFAFESPLQNDAYFYGRTQTVQFFYDKYKSGENSGLFGLRKIGKTSVLYALRRYLNLRNEINVFIDCQSPSFHLRRWYECLEIITNQINEEISIRNSVQKVRLNKDYNEKDAAQFFEEDLKKLYTLAGESRLLIIFDEIENITFDISPSEHWKTQNDFLYFWQSIRAVYQKTQNYFSFIIAGVNPKTIETGHIKDNDNPIYRMISPTYLKLFNHNDVEEMVKNIGNYMGLDFDKEIFTFLTDDYGGHPFLIRQVCSKIHQSFPKKRPQKVTKFFYRENVDKYNSTLTDYVEVIVDVLKKWYPNEYELLEALVLGHTARFDEIVETSEKSIEHLVGYNLIEKNGSNNYHININAVREYVIKKSAFKRKILTIDDKWQAITQRRNELELKLREIVKLVLKTKYGQKAKETFLSKVEERRRERLNNLNFQEIFSDKGEIYLLDLKVFISKFWSDFENIFSDKPKFEMYLDIVNTNRIDAHAKDINEDDLQITILALNWLDEKSNNFLE